MIFRWSIWGEHKAKSIELLKYSISSFKKQFGVNHEYVVYTDESESIKPFLFGVAKIIDFNTVPSSEYNFKSKATWMKWCPMVRLDITQTEFYVDSDVFLLKYPKAVDDFLNNPKFKFGILDEFQGQSWQHGSMQRKATDNTPFVNAGFFVQKAGFSISSKLSEELNWWKKYIPPSEQTHHDEQGALAIALTEYSNAKELFIFPKDQYMLIGPNENKDITNLDDVTLFHAVYPDHPAFYKFKNYLDKILGSL